MRKWSSHLREAFSATSLDADIIEELAQHAEATYDELRADGVSEPDALARIDRLIDGWRTDPSSLKRVIKRDTAVVPPSAARSFASGALADAAYGLRLLRKSPGYGAVTILTIALGVGAVTTLFSVANSVLLRPLPWATGDGLVRVIESRGGRQGRVPGTMLNGSYLSWAEAPQTIEAIGSWTTGAVTLTGAGDAARVTVANVSPSLLQVLRAQPLRGRLFTPEEGRFAPDNNWRIALLAQGFWEQRFGAREDIVGQTIMLEGGPATVVGIMPRGFLFPDAETQMWLPMRVAPVDGPNGVKRGQIFRALARLNPGVSMQQAAAEGNARAITAPDPGLVAMSLFGAKEPLQITLVDANDAATAEVRPAIVILLIAAGLLFVTAIANVANMQLARAAARHRELTIRAALGAGMARLSRQLLIENALIGVVGATLGVLLSAALHRVLPSLLPAGFPRADEIAIDGRVLVFAAVIAAIASIVAGMLPVLQARRLDITRALSQGTLASAGAGGRLAIARLLIAGSQVAVTSVLVISAVLLTRSFLARVAADRGYDPANVLTASVPFPSAYSFEQRQQARFRILERLRERPGISHAAFSTGVPLVSAGGFSSFDFTTPITGTKIQAETMRRVVTPDYFGALSVRIRVGRPLTDADTLGAPTAVVVNRSFVRKYLDDMPIEQAIGQSLGTLAVRGTQPDRSEARIVGVADDMRQDTVEAPEQPEMYVNMAQLGEAALGPSSIVIIRTVDDPVNYVETLRSVAREQDSRIALDGVMALEERVGQSLSRPRVYAVLLGGFAAFALLIAGTGLFGVLSFSVTQRSRELAVRSALGATRAGVIAVAIKQISVAVIAGLVIGIAAAIGLSNNLAPFLYGVSANDWLSFGVAPLVLMIVGVIACVVPARRVARTDPVEVLRET